MSLFRFSDAQSMMQQLGGLVASAAATSFQSGGVVGLATS